MSEHDPAHCEALRRAADESDRVCEEAEADVDAAKKADAEVQARKTELDAACEQADEVADQAAQAMQESQRVFDGLKTATDAAAVASGTATGIALAAELASDAFLKLNPVLDVAAVVAEVAAATAATAVTAAIAAQVEQHAMLDAAKKRAQELADAAAALRISLKHMQGEVDAAVAEVAAAQTAFDQAKEANFAACQAAGRCQARHG